MLFSRSLLLAALLTSLSAIASPIQPGLSKRITFTESKYPDFQISDGVAGDSEARANAVFAAFEGADLKTVTADQLDAVNNMRVIAEDAESTFNTAIAAAGGTKTPAGISLQAGKIANKVLKLTAEVLALEIETAQGEDQAEKIAEEETKLNNNIALDVKAKGTEMTPVDG